MTYEKARGKQVLQNIKNNTIIEKADVDSGYMILGYPTVGNNNLKEAYALGIAAEILAGGKNSILYKTLKEDDKLLVYFEENKIGLH